MPTDDHSSYEDTPQGLAKRWQREMEASHKDAEKWQQKAEKIVKRYLGRAVGRAADSDGRARLNLFTANTNTILSIMYGKVPRVSVDRKWSDQDDDVARVASVIMERMLNEDVENPDDCYSETLYEALQDRLVPGMGVGRVRYDAKFESQEMPPIIGADGTEVAPGYTKDVKVSESCPIEYVHWKDFRWSPARTWKEVRWVAFRAMMTKDAGLERFGEIFNSVPMKSPQQQKNASTLDVKDPWERACVWEIWDKERKQVVWYVEGFDQTLDVRDDPLTLPGFYPCGKPLHATMSTSHFMPFPDYEQAQDLYGSIDVLETRIDWLVKACKLVGVYDKSSIGIQRMFNESSETELIPVDNWAMFAEKGGIKGQIDWLPTEQVANTISILVQQRNDKIQLLYQATGLSDILRGQSEGGATATEQAIKARYASTRIQSLQDQFAKFATELQSLKAHIIVTQYDDQTIIERSNIMATPDAQFAQQAIQLLRSRFRDYRVLVRPEDLAIQDYATLKQERSEALGALSQFLPQMNEMAQTIPGSLPYLLELLKWGLQGFRGINTIEGVLDQAIETVKQQPPQEEGPDPAEEAKAQAETQKAAADVQKSQLGVQREVVNLQTAQVQAQSEAQKAQAQRMQTLINARTEMEKEAAAVANLPFKRGQL
jgi:hypothetical protein